jgi:MFS family permease
MPLFGRLGDQMGRKKVAIFFIVFNPLSVIGYYHVGGIMLLPILWLAMMLTDIGSDTNLTVFTQELFPTSHRSTAAGAWALIGQLGGSLGLALESVLFGIMGSHWLAVSALALTGLVVPFIVGFAYPETSRRPLEEISPER